MKIKHALWITSFLTSLGPVFAAAEETDVYIEVDTSGQVKVDGTPMTLDEAQTKFDTIFKQDLDYQRRMLYSLPPLRLHLHADPRTPCDRVFGVLSRLSGAAWPYLDDPCIAYPYVDISDSAPGTLFVSFPGVCPKDFEPGGKLYDTKVSIYLKDSGKVELNMNAVTSEELRGLLEALLDRSITRKALIRADGDVAWSEVTATARMIRGMCGGEIFLLLGRIGSTD